MAPMRLPMKPEDRKPVAEPPESAEATSPPTSEPATPSSVVIANPIPCRPGTTARAMRPMMKPKTIQAMMPMRVPLPRWEGTSRVVREARLPHCSPRARERAGPAAQAANPPPPRTFSRCRACPRFLDCPPPRRVASERFTKGSVRAARPRPPRARDARRVRSDPVHRRAHRRGRGDRGSPRGGSRPVLAVRVHRRRGVHQEGARGVRACPVRDRDAVRRVRRRPREGGPQERGRRLEQGAGEPVMRGRLLLSIAAAVAVGACATGGKLRENAEVIRADVEKAKRSGAVRCAPKELALAEANVQFSEDEVAFGHANRAKDHIDLAEKNVKEALRLSKTCGPTQVLISKKAPEPTPEPKKRIVEIEKTDSDGDGIPDDIDRCPLDPEDKDGFQDEDGCPDPDNDGDGIVDRADACPNEPGPLENRGCPVVDKDNDGVPDAEDKCPDVPGLKQFAGCPDTDADGIPDSEDKCPTQAGPKENGGCPDQDRDGDGIIDRLDKCPDQFGPPPDGCPKKYTLVEVKKEKIEIKQQVHFTTAKYRVLPDSFALLNQVVQVMNDFAKMRISIEGHTDNVGGETQNMRLSQRRAEAVRDYLVAKGISPARLEAIGYGPTKPIASNKTARGKGQNRRTEFRIMALE